MHVGSGQHASQPLFRLQWQQYDGIDLGVCRSNGGFKGIPAGAYARDYDPNYRIAWLASLFDGNSCRNQKLDALFLPNITGVERDQVAVRRAHGVSKRDRVGFRSDLSRVDPVRKQNRSIRCNALIL